MIAPREGEPPMPKFSPPPISGANNSSALFRLLEEGPLRPVSEIAAQELGRAVDPRTAWRWAMVGRRGRKLPTIRGLRRVRCTTRAAFRAWLEATSGGEPTAPTEAPEVPEVPATDAAADAVLRALSPRLGRKGA